MDERKGGVGITERNGGPAIGWKKVNGNWYHLKENRAMSTGWIKDGSHWYYLKASGEMQTGWLKRQRDLVLPEESDPDG